MTTVYKVKSKHTKEVLEDFIRFDNKVRHPLTKMHLTVLGIGFLVLGYLLRAKTAGMIACFVAGGIMLGIMLFSYKIAFVKLSSQDQDYIDQNEITYLFVQAELRIENPAWGEDVHVKYGEISMLYEDKKNFYICRNNEELYLLPHADFVEGAVDGFRRFLEDKTKKIWVNTQLPLKERIKRMNAARKEANRLHDEEVERRRKNKGR